MIECNTKAQTQYSGLQEVLGGLWFYNTSRRNHIAEITRRKIALGDNHETAISFLDSLGDSLSILASIPLEISAGNYTQAGEKISELPENDIFAGYADLYSVILTVDSSARNYDEMTSGEEALIRTIAGSDGPASHAARAILEAGFGEEWVELPDTIQWPESPKRLIEDGPPVEIQSSADESWMGPCYPHPVTGGFKIDVRLAEGVTDARLAFVTIADGKTLLTKNINQNRTQTVSISPGQLPAGLYACRLIAGDVLVSVRKMIVLR